VSGSNVISEILVDKKKHGQDVIGLMRSQSALRKVGGCSRTMPEEECVTSEKEIEVNLGYLKSKGTVKYRYVFSKV